VEEALLRKANQKRSLDDIVIQKGEFDWRTLFGDDGSGTGTVSGVDSDGAGGGGFHVSALEKALGEFEDTEDQMAREVAMREEVELTGADEADFGADTSRQHTRTVNDDDQEQEPDIDNEQMQDAQEAGEPEGDEEEEEGGTTVDYMLAFVQSDLEFFNEWRI
jgi:helicase SWR1